MRKFLSVCLSLIIIFVLIAPNKVDAATIKIDRNKVSMFVGDTTTLKLSGTTKAAKWSSSNKKRISVSSRGNITALKHGTSTITATLNGKRYTCKITAKYDNDTMKINMYNWIVDDLWNNSFCDIYHYIEDGKNAIGIDMDINKSISNADNAMKNLSLYDDFIDSLSKSEYEDLKDTWDSMKSEINYLYNRIKDETPRASDSTYEFKYQDFNDYMYEMMNLLL